MVIAQYGMPVSFTSPVAEGSGVPAEGGAAVPLVVSLGGDKFEKVDPDGTNRKVLQVQFVLEGTVDREGAQAIVDGMQLEKILDSLPEGALLRIRLIRNPLLVSGEQHSLDIFLRLVPHLSKVHWEIVYDTKIDTAHLPPLPDVPLPRGSPGSGLAGEMTRVVPHPGNQLAVESGVGYESQHIRRLTDFLDV